MPEAELQTNLKQQRDSSLGIGRLSASILKRAPSWMIPAGFTSFKVQFDSQYKQPENDFFERPILK
jgi:hypothetical protein